MKFSLHDEVFSKEFGKGKIVHVDSSGDYPILVEFHDEISQSYTREGKWTVYSFDYNPNLDIEPLKLEEDLTKPKRYNRRGKLECWDVIIDQEMNFLEGSILKYLWRYKEKGGKKDLEKIKVYVDKLIDQLEK